MKRRLQKIKSPNSLARELKRLGKNSRIVFTNGCFDLLHIGHVSYLDRAKSLGTHLIVALNSDSSVRKIKGPGRPINTLSDRLEVMAALEAVDYVTWFSDDTPRELIMKFQPHVLVKGGDYKLKNIVGAKEVLSWGGRVKSLHFVPNRSTSSIVKRVRAAKMN